jgi:uncharacterized protein YjiS (DUF1127 family)
MMRSPSLSARFVRRSPSLSDILRRFHGMLLLRRARKHLARLDDHLLCDIGLTRADAMAEARRAPWDAPSHWRG